jgi:hypothetical protein
MIFASIDYRLFLNVHSLGERCLALNQNFGQKPTQSVRIYELKLVRLEDHRTRAAAFTNLAWSQIIIFIFLLSKMQYWDKNPTSKCNTNPFYY